jgi:hypothetical protein
MKKAIFLLWAIALWSCQPGGKSGNEGQQTAYPSIPLDTIAMLWDQCDYIDYVFYYQDFSISQNQRGDIQLALRHISEEPPVIDPKCQPQGRIFYQVDGVNRLEGDLFFSQGCAYFIFYDKGKYTYANRIMPEGISFFNRVFNISSTPAGGQ